MPPNFRRVATPLVASYALVMLVPMPRAMQLSKEMRAGVAKLPRPRKLPCSAKAPPIGDALLLMVRSSSTSW